MRDLPTKNGGAGRLMSTQCQSQLRAKIETAPDVPASAATISEHEGIEIAGHRYMRQQQLAGILGVSARTLARWNSLGIGPPKIAIGKTVLFDLEKLPDWLAARETVPTRNRRR